MARFVHVDDFEISDLGKPKVDVKRFHYDVTNKMKEDMKDAYDRLIGRKGTAYEFIYTLRNKRPLLTERKHLVQRTTGIYVWELTSRTPT